MPSKVYLLKTNGDLTEGRGPMLLRGVFSSFEAAVDAARKEPTVMGARKAGTDSEIYEVEIDSVSGRWGGPLGLLVWHGYEAE